MFLKQIAKCLVGKFLKILHLIAAEEIDLLPDVIVELYPFAGH